MKNGTVNYNYMHACALLTFDILPNAPCMIMQASRVCEAMKFASTVWEEKLAATDNTPWMPAYMTRDQVCPNILLT